MANTGYKIFENRQVYDLDTNSYVAGTKEPNTEFLADGTTPDPDYIAPVQDLNACPTTSNITIANFQHESWQIKDPKVQDDAGASYRLIRFEVTVHPDAGALGHYIFLGNLNSFNLNFTNNEVNLKDAKTLANFVFNVDDFGRGDTISDIEDIFIQDYGDIGYYISDRTLIETVDDSLYNFTYV